MSRLADHGDACRSGNMDERSSKNSSIVRLAPVPMRYVRLFLNSIHELARLAAESSIATHASEQCCSACRRMALVLAGRMHGINYDEVLAPDCDTGERT